ncbi:MAG TPA: SIR2 family protein [Candidatus Nitrosocosmicus sp.]
MLFLGAGASNPVGIDDLQKLTKKIINELEKNGFKNILDQIINKLKEKNDDHDIYSEDEINIELILSIMLNTVDPKNALKNLGPYALYSFEKSSSEEISIDKNEMEEVLNITSRVISEHCKEFDLQKAKKIYEELENMENEGKVYLKSKYHDIQRFLNHIVTLNYDLVIEQVFPRFLGRRGLTTNGYEEYVLDLDSFAQDTFHTNNRIEYLKLHGSIDWRIKDSDGTIVKRECSESVYTDKATKQKMIYPIYDKRLTDTFSFTFYKIFLRILRNYNIYLVIGYSFADRSINEAFLNELKRNKTMIVSCGDTAKKML